MVIKSINYELYNSLKQIREKSVKELIDSPIVVDENITISKILGIILDKKTYEVFFQDKENKVIVISIKDLLNVKNIASRKSSSVGHTVPVLSMYDNIGHAAKIMNHHRVRTLPIVNNEKKKSSITGQITINSIISKIHEYLNLNNKKDNELKIIFKKLSAPDIMTPLPSTIRSNDTLLYARKMILKNGIDHIPVLDKSKDKLVGIITSDQIIQAMLPTERIGKDSVGIDNKDIRLNIPVKGIMNHNVTTVNLHANLETVIRIMLDTKSTYVLVMLGDEVQGIITFSDILTLLGDYVGKDDYAFIIGLPDDPIESEQVKSKFLNIISLLQKNNEFIIESKCRIKISKRTEKKKRYDVSVNIITKNKVYRYSKSDWELSKIIDQIYSSLKKQFSKKPSKKQTKSKRTNYL
ncbi:MAG: HPP family protein [Nitrososphaeraceae archaeon]